MRLRTEVMLCESSGLGCDGHHKKALFAGGGGLTIRGRASAQGGVASAIYETFACVFDFCDKATEHIQSRNFEKAGAFIVGRNFSARMKDFVSKDIIETETVDNTAVNILTQIDRLSKSFTGLKEEYDFLSERTHPNGLGSLDYFWESGDDIVRFSNEADRSHVIQSLLSAGRLLAIMEDRMKVLEGELAKVPPLWWRSTGAPGPGIRATGPTKATKVGRNDPCPCGSGKKYKACCLGSASF
jgi:hypothetical protein